MNFSDSIFEYLAQNGIRQVFAVPGGGNMFLINAAVSHPEIEVRFCHNEQAAAVAAEGYFRISRRPAVCLVTSGPGSTNALTGIVGAWLDSSPMIVLCGQVKTADLKNAGLRQKGPQEIDFVGMVAGSCLIAEQLMSPDQAIIIKAVVTMMRADRKGPVVLSIPLDVQNGTPSDFACGGNVESSVVQRESVLGNLLESVKYSQKPAILIGEGARDVDESLKVQFFDTCSRLGIMCLFSWLSYDMLSWGTPINMGRPGNVAKRHSNFVVQSADLLVAVGSRVDATQTAFNPNNFCRNGVVHVIDIDVAELEKHPARFHRHRIDATNFFKQFVDFFAQEAAPSDRSVWATHCQKLKREFGREMPSLSNSSHYLSIEEVVDFLSDAIPESSVIVTGSSGLSVEIFHVGFRNKLGQRIFLTTALGSMGFGLPAVIGAAETFSTNDLFLFESDGSFMMNLQELSTLKLVAKKIVCFLINNKGYASIRSSHLKHFDRTMGTDEKSGLSFPEFPQVIRAFGINCVSCSTLTELEQAFDQAKVGSNSVFIELLVEPDSELLPKCGVRFTENGIVSSPLEDMDPKLDATELNKWLEPAAGDIR